MTDISPVPRLFHLQRDRDLSGISGIGRVADGVLWPDGTVSIRWRGDRPSTVTWGSLADAEHVHGHGGATRIVWDEHQPDSAGTADTGQDNPPDTSTRTTGTAQVSGGGQPDSEADTDPDARLREQYAAAIRGCAEEGNVRYEQLADAVLAVQDRRLATMERMYYQAMADLGAVTDRAATAAEAERDRLTAEVEQLRATNQRLNRRTQQAESELGTYRRAVGQWEVNERGTYIPLSSLRVIGKAAGTDILGSVRHLAHFQRVEQAEAALARVRDLGDFWFREGDPGATREAGRRILTALNTPAAEQPTGPDSFEGERDQLAGALGGDRAAQVIAHNLAVHGCTLASVRQMTDEDLRVIPGVGDTSLARIRAALDSPPAGPVPPGQNAKDCDRCAPHRLPYPFICPGHPATDATEAPGA